MIANASCVRGLCNKTRIMCESYVFTKLSNTGNYAALSLSSEIREELRCTHCTSCSNNYITHTVHTTVCSVNGASTSALTLTKQPQLQLPHSSTTRPNHNKALGRSPALCAVSVNRLHQMLAESLRYWAGHQRELRNCVW